MRTRLSGYKHAVLSAPPVARSAGLVVIAIVAAVLAGWIARTLGWAASPAWIYRMNPMTAAGFAFAGTALLLPRTTRVSIAATLKLALGCGVCAIGLLRLAKLIIGQPDGVDLLLIPRAVQSFNVSVLIAPNSALALVLLGGALILSTRRRPQAPLGAQLLAAVTLAIATSGLIAHAYGAISGIEFTSTSAMAFESAVALGSASIGVLWTRPHRALTGIMTNPTFGGITARRLLPIILLTTVGLGALLVAMARLGVFDEFTRMALLVTAILITLIAVVLIFAWNLRNVSLRLLKREEALSDALMRLAHANRVTTMGQLTASIAHEVAQPIAATATNAQAGLNWLDAQPRDLEKVREMFGCIIGDSQRAGDVIGRIRDLMRKAPPRKEDLHINEIVLEVIAVTRNAMVKNGVSLRTQLAENLPLIQADRVQLQQVMLNLIMNAVEAMSDIGEGPRELLISTGRSASKGVLVRVGDSGPGLHLKLSDRLFEPFYTTKVEGMGMGLAICRSIIEAHGGRLWSGANEPRGAVFQFTLPIDENVPVMQPDPVPADEIAGRGSDRSRRLQMAPL